VRTTARMHAFIPGESPPEVNTPIFLMSAIKKSARTGTFIFLQK
jgi:hypothetical protein